MLSETVANNKNYILRTGIIYYNSFNFYEKRIMFCPKCGSEYKEGFYKCSDCGTDLIDQLPPEPDNEVSYVELVEIYSTYRQSDIAFIKSVLDGEGITYFFEGESSIMLVAGGAYARLLVKAEEADRAKEILRELGFL
ncbi:MAG: hypothetical protein APR62_00060 [Smithella sp. SDB]|nr:MAG: hypothetical protein APR62_00060 [Smithella sp. SDB]